jgi:hypothetical protein
MTRTKRAFSALACAVLMAAPAGAPSAAQPDAHAAKRHHRSFCERHRCIPYFHEGHGYIVQCRDGMWSHSGGRPGVCSGHSGGHRVVASRSCGHIRDAGTRFLVSIEKGNTSCHRARHVLKVFLAGKGHHHGPRHGPMAEQYWTIGRWKCGYFAGGGGCSRGGHSYKTARDFISATS